MAVGADLGGREQIFGKKEENSFDSNLRYGIGANIVVGLSYSSLEHLVSKITLLIKVIL